MPAVVTKLAVPLKSGTLRERGSKLRGASRREVRATPTLTIWYKFLIIKQENNLVWCYFTRLAKADLWYFLSLTKLQLLHKQSRLPFDKQV